MNFTSNNIHFVSFDHEVVIQITLNSFPFDTHDEWLSGFCEYFSISKGDVESSAELTQMSIYFENSVFILYINDLIESIWITHTRQQDKALAQLKQLFEYLRSVCSD